MIINEKWNHSLFKAIAEAETNIPGLETSLSELGALAYNTYVITSKIHYFWDFKIIPFFDTSHVAFIVPKPLLFRQTLISQFKCFFHCRNWKQIATNSETRFSTDEESCELKYSASIKKCIWFFLSKDVFKDYVAAETCEKKITFDLFEFEIISKI